MTVNGSSGGDDASMTHIHLVSIFSQRVPHHQRQEPSTTNNPFPCHGPKVPTCLYKQALSHPCLCVFVLVKLLSGVSRLLWPGRVPGHTTLLDDQTD